MKRRTLPIAQAVARALQNRAQDEHLRGSSTWRRRLGTLAAFGRGELAPLEGETREQLEQRIRLQADAVAAQRRRWRDGDRIALALQLVEGTRWTHEIGQLVEDQDGQLTQQLRSRIASVEIEGRTLELKGRAIRSDWRVNPESDAVKLSTCCRTWLVGRRASGKACEFPIRCDRAICPDCADHRALHGREGIAEAAIAMVQAGCRNVLVTLTQDARPGPGLVVLTDAEVKADPKLLELHTRAESGQAGTSTGGETLLEAVDRLTHALGLVTGHSRRTRSWWRACVAGAVWGIETTGRATDRQGRPVGPLRWHAHAHGSITLWPGISVDAFRERLLREWQHAAGVAGSMVEDGAQDVQDLCQFDARVAPADAIEAVKRSVRQAIKYPGKLGGMTTAQVVEFVGALKGRKLQRRSGIYDSSTRAGAMGRHLAVIQLEGEDQACELTREDSAAALTRWGIDPEPDATRAALCEELLDVQAGRLVPAVIEAWCQLLGRVVEGEDDDPMLGVLVSRTRDGAPQLLTRSRLRAWAKVGKLLELALAPPGTATESQAAALELEPDAWSWVESRQLAAALDSLEDDPGPPPLID